MNLPPLPEPSPYVPVYRPLWAEDKMREYGALCYRQALEQAAKKVDHIMFFNGKTFGEKIMELLK